MLPTPRWTGAAWQVDLRKPWGFGRHLLDRTLPAPPAGLVPAIHAAYALLDKLRREAPPAGQPELPGTGGRTLGQVLGEYTEARKYRSIGNRRHVTETAARIARELGNLPLVEVSREKLTAWKESVRRGYDRTYPGGRVLRVRVGPKSMRKRVRVLSMALEWARGRGYLQVVPELPDPKLDEGEVIWSPGERWTDEGTFRAVRDAIYADRQGLGPLEALWSRVGLPWPGCTVEDYIARRHLYLSFALYTGLRRADLDALDDRSVAMPFGVYYRTSRKTHLDRGVPERMPPPLVRDLEFELARRRLHAFPRGDLIAGGPWPRVTRVLRVACERVGVEPFDLRTLRRSFAYHKAMGGAERGGLARLMSHASSQMLDHVYNQVPDAGTRDDIGACWPEMTLPGASAARIIPITVGKGVTASVAKVSQKVSRTPANPASSPVGEGGTAGAQSTSSLPRQRQPTKKGHV